KLSSVNDASRNNRPHGRPPKTSPIEGRVAGFTGGFFGTESPFMVWRKNRQIPGLIFRNAPLHAQHAPWARGEQFDQTHQRKFSRVDQFHSQRKRSLKSGNTKRSAVKFHVF